MRDIRVGACDDDSVFLQVISDLINATDGLTVAWACASADQVLDPDFWKVVDLVLLDVRMTPISGIEIARALAVQDGAPRILFFSSFDEKPSVRSAIQSKISGFLLKDTPAEGIRLAIRGVFAGLHVFSPTPIGRLASAVESVPPKLPSLSPRERDVLRLVCLGSSNGTIAGRLHLAESTVKGIVSNLLIKLDATSRGQAIAHAHAWGIDTGDG